MIVHVYTSVHNEAYMMPYFLRHYCQFAEKIFVYDDDSTDGTVDILKACPQVEIKSPGFSGIDEILLQELRSNEYKKYSRGVADWVMIVDCDEFHFDRDMFFQLGAMRLFGARAIISNGFDMFSESPPCLDGQIYEEVTRGIPDGMYDRLIFDPALDVIVGIGNHDYSISPRVRVHPGPKLLHCKFLGADYLAKRNQKGWERLSQRNHEHGWGIHSSPDWKGPYSVEWFKEMLGKAESCLE